ncbi:hypothetical protein MKEN_00700900 [Mycena kentingensis (nom. inval.)]|nr:hypothetical protein MKEN_00700900 [Mycena kentingensis (nom. inval.)]
MFTASRAATPTAPKRFVYYQDSVHDVSRSQSRVRPGRVVDLPFPADFPRRATSTPAPASENTKVPLHQPLTTENLDTGEDAAWDVYNREAELADSSMVEGWNRSMDVLLVFTGLFSAVLTTFIIQSYSTMVPDATEQTNVLLLQLIALQSNTSVTPTPAPQQHNSQMHVVNGLWLAALACSLSTALISMLAKQWLQAYVPTSSGSPRHRARQRQERYLHFRAWHVPEIINALPILLHVALLLFFAGLVVLLWSADLAITLSTWTIVACAYAFYVSSIAIPLIYPECPYKHSIADHLRVWFSREGTPNYVAPIMSYKRRSNDPEDPAITFYDARALKATFEDMIDATVLVWLFSKSNDQDVVSVALKAIASLPHDFTGLKILRDAGALELLEQAFQKCFNKDTTVDLQWHLIDPESAALFCRAWIKLTRGTGEQWPFPIVVPLWMLQELDLSAYPDTAAIASCAVALSSFDSHTSQWELLVYLARCAAGEVILSQTTQCCLLDSISECFVRWEMPAAVIEDTLARAVPVLLRVLRLTEELPNSKVRSATALALYILTVTSANSEPVDLGAYMNEEKRRSEYCELMLQALSAIVETPDRFGVKDGLFDIVALELARLSSPVVAYSERFPHRLRAMARASLSTLYAAGRIGQGIVPDKTLADVLQLCFPPVHLTEPQRTVFVTTLVETLDTSSHPDIASWGVRLLEILLSHCSSAISQAFVESNGIEAVVRTARRDDSRRLQIDSLRTMCAFVDSASSAYKTAQIEEESKTGSETLSVLFESDFFETLCGVVAARRWWLYEVSGHWLPALVKLARIQPEAKVWPTVLRTFREFADRNVSEEGYSETLIHLGALERCIKIVE